MNAIQEYLLETALQAAREAAGRLIADPDFDPVQVAQSLGELDQAVRNMAETTASQIPCNAFIGHTSQNKQILRPEIRCSTGKPILPPEL